MVTKNDSQFQATEKKLKNAKELIIELPVGTRIVWHLDKKEYKKVNDEKPFSRWESLNGGVLFIDDVRVRRKDFFTIVEQKWA
jgi:hypothetical protein